MPHVTCSCRLESCTGFGSCFPFAAMAQDEPSLSALAASSALASRVWVHERLGRTDVQVSCVCPWLCLCLLVCYSSYGLSLCLRCSRYSGPVEECHRVTQKTQLRFTWHLAASDLTEVCEVRLRCDNAMRHGVHLPKAWRKKRDWMSAEVPLVDTWSHEAVRRVRDDFSLPPAIKLDCRPFQTTHTCTHARTHLSTRIVAGMLATLRRR